jgi:hypothetical protein
MSEEPKEIQDNKGNSAIEKFFSQAYKWSDRIIKIGGAVIFVGGVVAFLYPIVCGFVWTWRDAIIRTLFATVPPVFNAVVIWLFTKFLFASSVQNMDWKKLGRYVQLLMAGVMLHASAIVFCLMVAVSKYVEAKSTFTFDAIGWIVIATSLIIDGTTLIIMPLVALCVVVIVVIEQIAKFNGLLFPQKTEETPVALMNVEQPSLETTEKASAAIPEPHTSKKSRTKKTADSQ